MPLDLNDPSQNTVSDTTPNTPAANTPPVAQTPQTGAPSAPTQTPAPQSQPATQPQPVQQPGVVSNAPANDPNANHPGVQRAGILHTIAETLAGGPRFTTTIDPNTGITTRTKVPLSRGDIALAIVSEALSGGLAGLAQRGPGATGRAAAAGFDQVSAQQQQANQQAEAQAQQDAQSKGKALAQSAAIHEQNARTVLTTQQAERMGIDSLKDSVDANAALLQNYKDAGAVGDENVTQDALMSGMQSGQYNGLSMTAIPDGWTVVPGKGPEQTFAIITKPSEKVTLTQDQVDEFAANHVRGFPKGMKIPQSGYPVSGYLLGNANQQLLTNRFMLSEANDVATALAKSNDPGDQALAKNIPDFGKLMDDDKTGPALQNALPKLQKYLHHDGSGDTFYQALVTMSQPTRPNPQNPKQAIDNTSDASAAQVIAGAFGNGDPAAGWKALRAYHNAVTPEPIKSESDAESILSDSASTPREKTQAKQYLQLVQQQKAGEAGAEARAKKSSEGVGGGAGNPALIQPNPEGGVNLGYLNSLPAGQRAIVQAIGEGRQEGPNTRTKEGRALSEIVNNAYPGYDGTRYHTYQAMQKDFVSGKTSQGLIALNTALSHLNILYDNANFGSTLPGVSGIERLAGNSSAIALKNAQVAVADELGKAYKSGVVTESERKEWMQQLSGWTPANVKQSAAAFAHLLDGKIAAYEQTLRNGAPSGAVKLPALMSPEAGAAYSHITGEAPTTTVGSRSIGQSQTPQPPVAGAIAGRDASGRIVAWRLPDGTVQRVQQ